MSNSQVIKNFLGNKPLMSSALGAGAMVVLQKQLGAPSGSMKLPFTETRVPLFAVGALLGFGSSFITDLISDMVLSHIPQSQKFKHVESIVLHLLISGSAFAMVPKILYTLDGETGFDMSKMKLFGMAGIVAEGASQIIHEFINKNQGAGAFNAESFFNQPWMNQK